MAKTTVHTETLRRAADAMGGEVRLAHALRKPVELVRHWLTGSEYPPTEIYHQALDLLIGMGTH